MKDRTAGWQIFGERTPLTARAQHIQQAVKHFTDIDRPLSSAPARRGNKRSNSCPLLLGHLTGISQLVAVIACSVLCRPHARLLLTALFESQLPLLLQEPLGRTLRGYPGTLVGESRELLDSWRTAWRRGVREHGETGTSTEAVFVGYDQRTMGDSGADAAPTTYPT